MAKCKQCGQNYKSRRSTSSYCSSKCKQEFYRNRLKDNVTVSNAKTVIVTDFEKCQYCGIDLQPLQKPRQYPGACYNCAIQQPNKPVQSANEGHILASRPALERTQPMTIYEQTFYHTAAELEGLKARANPVSKPGRACYSVFQRKDYV